MFFKAKLPIAWEKKKRQPVLKYMDFERGQKLYQVFNQTFWKQALLKDKRYRLASLCAGVLSAEWLIKHFSGPKKE